MKYAIITSKEWKQLRCRCIPCDSLREAMEVQIALHKNKSTYIWNKGNERWLSEISEDKVPYYIIEDTRTEPESNEYGDCAP